MHIFNDVYERVFSKFPVHPLQNDVDSLANLFAKHCTDTKFNKLVCDAFKHFDSAYSFKQYIKLVDENAFSPMPISGADNILTDVFKETQSQSIRNFIMILKLAPADFLMQCAEKYDKLGFKTAYDAFSDFVGEEVLKIAECPQKDQLRLVAYLCQHDKSICDRALLSVKFGDNFKSFAEIYDDIKLQHYRITHPDNKLQGFNLEPSLASSVRMMAILAPHWNEIKASAVLRNMQLPKVHGMRGGAMIQYTDSDIVNIMCGKYNLIGNIPSGSGQILADLVTNYKLFNQYSHSRKVAVSNFLNANRDRFNEIIKNATNNIINYAADFMESNISKELNNAVTFGADRAICNDVKAFAEKFKSATNKAPMDTFADRVTYVCNTYIPLLKQFKNRGPEKYSKYAFSSTIQQFAMSKPLQIFAVADLVEFAEPYAEAEPRIIERVVEHIKEVPVEVRVPAMTGGKKESFDEVLEHMPHTRIEGGESQGESLVNKLVDILTSFTGKFTSLYRQLTKNLAEVPLINCESGSEKAYGLIQQFYEIAITSNKTTQYISGVWGDKDYNKLYKIALASLINGIQKSDLKGFDSVVSTLQSMIQLLDTIKTETDKFEAMYVTSPKSAAELFTVSAKALKIENDLTKTDYIKYNDAVKRLYNSIYNNKSQNDALQEKIISDYSKSVQDREQAIISHYKSEIDVINFQYHQHVANLGGASYEERTELEQIKNAKIAVQNRFKDAICYYNQTVDPAILQFRKKIASNALTHEQLDKIMDAWTSFKHTIIDSADFKKLMSTIGKHLNAERHSVNEYANLIECLKKLMKKGNYIQFLKVLHNQAGINVEGFKWDELEDKMYDIIALKSIAFNETDENKLIRAIEKLPGVGAYMSVSHRHDAAGGACTILHTAVKDTNFNNNNDILSHMTCNATHGGVNVINNAANVNGLVANAFPMAAANDPLITAVIAAPGTNPGGTTINHIQSLITGMFVANNNVVQANHTYAMTAIGKICVCLDSYLYEQGNHVAALTNEQKDTNEKVINAAFKAIQCIANSVIKADANAQNEFKKFCQYTAYRMVESPNTFELQLTEAVYKSLSVDLFGAIDNYLTSRYTGILSLPLHVNTLFKGGSNGSVAEAIKQSGGSWFDIGMQHVSTDSKVIADATPFYIIAFNVINFYFNRFAKHADATDLQKQVRMKVHKVSYLYPLYKIFKDDANFKFESISDTDFKLFIDVCNKIWTNNATGNLDAQLKKSISTLFNELNAAIVYGGDDIVALIESGASKETINSTMYTKIKEQMKELTQMVTEAITDAIDPALTPEQNSEVFESILGTAMKQVKEQPEPYQIAKLKRIILEKNDDKFLQDYYKFMELAVMPLLTCASSYNNLFAIFGVAEAGYDQHNLIDIDLSQLFMNFPVCVGDGGKGPFAGYQDRDMITMQVSEFCRYMTTDITLFNKYKSQLFEHPVVYMYNKVLLNNAFTKFHVTGKFTLPNFWVPIDESSYPTSPKLAVEQGGIVNGNKVLIPASFRLFKQIFPECTGKTLYDYYEYAINMFSQDCEQFINAFISYPGISDRTRKFIVDKAKSLFSAENVRNRAIVKGFNQQNEDQFKHISLTKANDIQQPPVVGENIVLPLVIEAGSIVEPLSITQQPADEHGTAYCRLGDTPFYVQQKFSYVVSTDNTGKQKFSLNTSTQHISKCEYTWLDWVLINIALADRVNVSLPAKFISMLQSNNEIQPYIRTAVANPQVKGTTLYQQLPNGKYPCIVTQNILSRSILPSRKENSEYALLSKAHVASIVGMLPYLISTLQAVKETTSNDVQSDYGRFNTKIQNLIDTLKLFYADISAYVSFIPFMADATQLSATANKPHIFAELCDLVATKSASTAEPSDFAKMEWANMWFFNNISSLQFPDFKNKDRFEWMSEFAPEIVKNSIYKQTYTQSIQTLARNAWMSLIAKTFDDNMHREFTDVRLDAMINNVINIMCECAPEYVQPVIDEIIAHFKPNLRTGLTGGGEGDEFDDIDLDDPSVEPYKESIQRIMTAITHAPITTDVMLPPTKATGYNKATNTGERFGRSQWVRYEDPYINELLEKLENGNKIDNVTVATLFKPIPYFYSHYPRAYDEIIERIDDRINTIINRTQHHIAEIKCGDKIDINKLISDVRIDVKQAYDSKIKNNLNSLTAGLNLDDTHLTTIPGGQSLVVPVAKFANSGGAVTIDHQNIIVGGTLGTIDISAAYDALTDAQRSMLQAIYTVVEGISKNAGGYITRIKNYVHIAGRKAKYQLFDEIIDSVLPETDSIITNLAAAGGEVTFTLTNMFGHVLACVLLGDTAAAAYTLFKDTRFTHHLNITFAAASTTNDRCNTLAANFHNARNTSAIDKLNLAVAFTAWIGLKYISYVETIFASPIIRELENMSPNWPLHALFYSKLDLPQYVDNLLMDDNIITANDSFNNEEVALPAILVKTTLMRMAINGMYLDAPTGNNDYIESLKSALQSCDNYIMFRLFARKFNKAACDVGIALQAGNEIDAAGGVGINKVTVGEYIHLLNGSIDMDTSNFADDGFYVHTAIHNCRTKQIVDASIFKECAGLLTFIIDKNAEITSTLTAIDTSTFSNDGTANDAWTDATIQAASTDAVSYAAINTFIQNKLIAAGCDINNKSQAIQNAFTDLIISTCTTVGHVQANVQANVRAVKNAINALAALRNATVLTQAEWSLIKTFVEAAGYTKLLSILHEMSLYEGSALTGLNTFAPSSNDQLVHNKIPATIATSITHNGAGGTQDMSENGINGTAAYNFNFTDMFNGQPNISSAQFRKIIILYAIQTIAKVANTHDCNAALDCSVAPGANIAVAQLIENGLKYPQAGSCSFTNAFRSLIYGAGNDVTGSIEAYAAAAGRGAAAGITRQLAVKLNNVNSINIDTRLKSTNPLGCSILFKRNHGGGEYNYIIYTDNQIDNGAHTVNQFITNYLARLIKINDLQQAYLAAEPQIFGGKPFSLEGGVIRSYEDYIYAIARGIASNATSRLIYYDPTLKEATAPTYLAIQQAVPNGRAIGATPAGPVQRTIGAMYIYNPTLLQRHYPHTNTIISSLQAFNQEFITSYRLNVNRMFAIPNYNTLQHGAAPAGGAAISVFWQNGQQAALTGQANVARNTNTVGIIARNAINDAIPTTLIVNIRNDRFRIQTQFKQVIKRVNVSSFEQMLQLIPYSACSTSNLFSPRKPIYNVTFKAASRNLYYTAPLVQAEYNDFATFSGLACRTGSAALHANYPSFYIGSDKFAQVNSVSFSSLHELLEDCHVNQFIDEGTFSRHLGGIALAGNDFLYVNKKDMNYCGTGVVLGNNAGNFSTRHTFASVADIDYTQLNYITVIDQFIQSISETSNILFNEVINNNGNRSQGFAFLKGGANDHTGLASSFYHIENIAGISPKEVLGSAYGNNLNELTNMGKQLFEAVFRKLGTRVSGGDRAENPILAMSLNYFKQTPLSISAMYEQIAFPSIVFNSSVYNSFTQQIKKVVTGIDGVVKPTLSTANRNIVDFIKKYITYGGDNKLTLDNYKFDGAQIPTDINDQTMPVAAPGGALAASYIRPINFENSYLAAIDNTTYNNLYRMPSLNSSFMGALARYTWYDYSQFTHSKSDTQTCIYRFESAEITRDTQYVRALLPTTLMQFIKYLDSSTTYLYAIFELGKQASFYDVDGDTEVPYSNRIVGDAFDMKI